MNYERIKAGHYQSEDGRVEIIKVKRPHSRRNTQLGWEAWVDGKALPSCELSKRDAIKYVEKYLENRSEL